MSDGFDLLIWAPRAIIGDSEIAAAIGIRDGRIAAIEPLERASAATAAATADAMSAVSAVNIIELDPDVVLLPGLVDSHVHVCEPGHTDWEGFATATSAAAAGGITTLVDMPLDSVPSTVTVAALEIKRQAAAGQCHVDVGFWGGVIPGNLSELAPLHEAGVLGFKCFLGDSGSADFPAVQSRELGAALSVLSGLCSPLLVHAESAQAAAARPQASGRTYAGYLASRPRELENLAIAQVIDAAQATGGRAHIVHLSSSDALPMIASAHQDGVAVSAETCPHYLTLAAEEIPDGATAAKCSPPVREAANRDLLWEGLRAGILDLIASDHSPCTPAMKETGGDFGAAWGGISSLQLGLPLVWTAARNRDFSLNDVADWMSKRPAQLASLGTKGQIAVGFDADFCVLAPDESFVVDPAQILHRHPATPYAGRTLAGVVRGTMLGGEWTSPGRPRGRLLSRGAGPARRPLWPGAGTAIRAQAVMAGSI